ncbi:MAG: endolytic transglycosylase MltG [Solirubrobacteraceae bacterium]
MAERRERTAAEREAARLERARRRAESRVGNPPPAPAFVDYERLEPEIEDVDPPGAGHDDLDAVDDRVPAVDRGDEAVDQPSFEHPTNDGPPAWADGRMDGAAAAIDGAGSLPQDPFEEFDDPDVGGDDHAQPDEHHEEPSGTRRISRQDGILRRQATVPRAERARRHGRSRGGRDSARGPVRRHLGRAVAVVALIAAGALAWFLNALFEPFGTSPHGRITVVIAPTDSSTQIGNLLARDGVISSGFFFELRATIAGERGSLRPGTYHLQLGMSYSAVLAALTKPPPPVKTSNITIVDGHTRQYVAKLLHEQGIRGNYLADTRSSPLLDPHSYGAPRHVPSLEGFLFPDTFNIVDPVTAKALVADQLRDFKLRFATVDLSYARRHHLTPYDVLKIASLVEGEAATPADGRLVASVIYNRLRDGMMLQMDSTTRYATGNFTRPLTVSQLQSKSPYNTRTHFGLPPTPINSPGLVAIQAAAHPAQSNYLYFFAKPCTNRTVFASTYTQFQNLLVADYRPRCPKGK